MGRWLLWAWVGKFFTLKNAKITSAVFLWFTLLGLFIDRFNILLLINIINKIN